MIHTPPLTPEVAQRERARLLDNLRFHRIEAKAAKRDLERLEAGCARVGIRLIRVPIQTREGENHASSADPHAR